VEIRGVLNSPGQLSESSDEFKAKAKKNAQRDLF
jgi:hypothetical protein